LRDASSDLSLEFEASRSATEERSRVVSANAAVDDAVKEASRSVALSVAEDSAVRRRETSAEAAASATSEASRKGGCIHGIRPECALSARRLAPPPLLTCIRHLAFKDSNLRAKAHCIACGV
jgi:hypothetical protein